MVSPTNQTDLVGDHCAGPDAPITFNSAPFAYINVVSDHKAMMRIQYRSWPDMNMPADCYQTSNAIEFVYPLKASAEMLSANGTNRLRQ
jgi:hypothetical protein